jgi:hypothetical protein
MVAFMLFDLVFLSRNKFDLLQKLAELDGFLKEVEGKDLKAKRRLELQTQFV